MARAKFANEIWYVIVCDVLTPNKLPHCAIRTVGISRPNDTISVEIHLSHCVYINFVCRIIITHNGRGLF